MRNNFVVIFNGISHFVNDAGCNDAGYFLMDDERVVYEGSYEKCVEVCELLNIEIEKLNSEL
jgi:hypothetical protein